MSNEVLSVEHQLVGLPLAGPESFSAEQLAYLKRALGVDETVLFESDTAASSFTTSEPIENFKSIKVVVNGQENTVGVLPVCIELPILSDSTYSSTLAITYGSPYVVSSDWCLFWTTRYTRSGNAV